MPYTPESLMAYFDENNLEYQCHNHKPVFTVAESEEIKNTLPGAHSKNLFLKDKKGNLALFSAHADTQVDLKALSDKMGLGRFSFGKPPLLEEKLGVTPGSVTPFALINDNDNEVHFALDETFKSYDLVNFHPLVNTMTIAMPYQDFEAFISFMGRKIKMLDVSKES